MSHNEEVYRKEIFLLIRFSHGFFFYHVYVIFWARTQKKQSQSQFDQILKRHPCISLLQQIHIFWIPALTKVPFLTRIFIWAAVFHFLVFSFFQCLFTSQEFNAHPRCVLLCFDVFLCHSATCRPGISTTAFSVASHEQTRLSMRRCVRAKTAASLASS